MPEQPPDHTPKQRLLCLIKEFRSSQKGRSTFSDYDSQMKKYREKYSERSESITGTLKEISTSLFEVVDQTFFIFEVILWKIHFLADGIEHAVIKKNPISLANNARSMVEHIATFSAVGKHVDKLVDDLEGQQSEEKILAVLQKSKEFIRRIFYGKKPGGNLAGQSRQYM